MLHYILLSLLVCNVKVAVLLDGQKIATKLSRRISVADKELITIQL